MPFKDQASVLRDREEREKLLDVEREAAANAAFEKRVQEMTPGTPLKNPIPSKSGDPWADWYRRLEKFDGDFCGVAKDEIDKVLVLAGLFSAALTAFVIEAYQWLEDPMDNPKVKVYVHVSNQIANITNATPFTPEPFVPSASVIRINILWFLSLILSLGSVLIGILCHQWIREYQRDVTHVSYRAAIGIRQIRYQGYVAWYIPQIVSAVPLLLLVSVTLFFVGILDLLHDRNPLVAYIVLAPTSFIIGFLCVTTMLPGIQLLREIAIPAPGYVSEPPPMTSKAPPELNEDVLPVSQCSFKSPQAWLFQQGLLKIAPFFYRVWCTLRPNNPTADDMTFREALPEAAGARTWINLDEVRQTKYFGTGSPDRYLCEAWKWSHENICQAKEAFYDLLSCYSQLDERSISLVLRTQPERIRGDVYGGEDYSLIQGQLAMPIWLDLWAKSRHYIRSDRLFAPFDREAALLCYLAGKHLPLNLEGSFYPLKAELYDRLFVSLDGQLLAAFEAPMWRPEPRTTTMVYNISNRGTLFNFEIDDIRWDLDYLKPDERNYLIRKIGDWYLSEYYRTKGRTDQLCRRLIKDYSAGYTSDGWFDLAIDLVQYVLAGSVEGDPGQGFVEDAKELESCILELAQRTLVVPNYSNQKVVDRLRDFFGPKLEGKINIHA